MNEPPIGTTLLLDGWHGTETWTRTRKGWTPNNQPIDGVAWWAVQGRATNMETELRRPESTP